MNRIRLTAVLTHPIQYYAPWFRHITAHAAEIDLTVVHATEPTAEQQGVGFNRAFTWDVPLTAGYQSITVRPARPGDRVDSDTFFGLDVRDIGDAVERTRPDVVLITGWYSITLVRALFACRRLGIPTLYRGDSHLLSGPTGWRRAIWRPKTRWLLGRFDGYLSPGTRVREYLGRFGVPDYRVFDVPHAIDNEMFAANAAAHRDPRERAAARRAWGIPERAFVPVFVGKLIPSKRVVDVLQAASRLGAATTPLIVGSGPLESSLRAEAQRLGLNARFAGFLNQTELGRAYAAADCLTLPSDYPETWGLVANEALASGLPIIVSTAVGCAPDLATDGETGYTHAPHDIDALADRLRRVKQQIAEGHDFSTACRERASRFSYAAMTSGLARACRSVLRHSTGGEPDFAASNRRLIACCGQMVLDGGLERMTMEVLRTTTERGVAAHCIVNGWENFRITPLAERAGASWSTGPYWYPLARRNLTPGKLAQMAWEILRVSADLLRVARRVRPTHLLLPDYQTILRNLPALALLRARGVRVVARLGNAPDQGRFYRALWRHVLAPHVDLFVCNSPFGARELLAHGVAAAKVAIIPNAPARRLQAWSGTSGPRVPGRIIYVGQIIPEKGLDLLLDAVAQLRARGLDVTLDVIGEMNGWEADTNRGYRAAQRERAARPDLAGAVNFLGWREDIPAVMARASLHCCPSRPEQREAFGNVVLEAKLSGLPSIVGPSGQLPDFVEHGQNGWLCADASPDAVAEGLLFFLDNPRRLEAAGRAALASAAEFSRDRFDDAWAGVFDAAERRPLHARIAV